MKTRNLLILILGIILMTSISNAVKAQDPFKGLEENGYAITVKEANIVGFVTAYLSDPQDEHMGSLSSMWRKYLKNEPFENGDFVTVDTKNGFVRFETSEDSEGYSSYTEMCYWNCDDGRHKLFAENVGVNQNFEPVVTEFTGMYIFVYDNVSQHLYFIDQELLGLGDKVRGEATTFRLPRKGKDIEVFFNDGTEKLLVWNGKGFTLTGK